MTVETKIYDLPPVNRAEALRYAGVLTPDGDMNELLDAGIAVLTERPSYSVCYCILPLEIRGNVCDFGAVSFESADLAENLAGCKRAAIFAATLGVEPDRLIIRYGRLLPSRGIMLSAVADERVEALCNAFCTDVNSVSPRFSPGYGDLPLEAQKKIFTLLDCPKKLGLTLNESLLMSPSKSVTAIVGVE